MDEAEQQVRRQRLKELLAIPDRERTDAQWDELNELEIMMAVSNRPGAPIPGNKPGGQQHPRQGGQPNQPGSPGGGRKFHNRPRRGRPPPGRQG
jgi:hypothetical protein